MKNLKFLSPIPLIIFIIAIFLPFVEHTTTFQETTITLDRGIDLSMIFLPLGIMIVILLVANIKRIRFTAIISFVMCFGLIFSIFLLQFQMKPVSSYTVHEIQTGYLLAFFSALILMVILLVNLVKTFRTPQKSDKSLRQF